MSNLQIYSEEKQVFGEIAFVRDVKNQVKIREINNPALFLEQLGLIMVRITNHLAIKEAITDIQKSDIKELIMMRFNHLSLDEFSYAFKLERYGVLGDKTSHYQLFNADYVSEVVGKYLKYRQKIRFENNLIIEKYREKATSEKEKKASENSILKKSLDYFIKNEKVDMSRFYVYDILYTHGYLPTDLEYKKEIKIIATQLLKREHEEKKPINKEERNENKRFLLNLNNEPALIIKCKELVIQEFFEELVIDKKKLLEFKNKIK